MMKLLLGWLLLLGLLVGSLYAQPVRVEEVQTYMHELPVAGFRMRIERPVSEMRRGIRTYLKAFSDAPFEFENSLVYEQLNYAPVSTAQPLTLYYVLENEFDLFTRLTLIALLDYREALSTRQTPDLALRLLLDASEMIQKISGEELVFDHLFETTDARGLEMQFVERSSSAISKFYLQHQGDRIGDSDEILLRKNPFEIPAPEDFASDEQVKDQLARRFHTYMERGGDDKPSPFVSNRQADLLQLYRDSLTTVMAELTKYRQEAAFSKLSATDALVKGGAEKLRADSLASRLIVAQALNRELTRQNERLVFANSRMESSGEPHTDSTLAKLRRLESQMSRLRTEFTLRNQELVGRNEELRRQLKSSQQETEALLSQLLEAQTRVQKAETAEELARTQAAKQAAETELEEMNAANKQHLRELTDQIGQLQQENETLLEQLLDAQLRHRELQNSLQEAIAASARTDRTLDERERKNRELETELRLLRDDLMKAEKRLGETDFPATDASQGLAALYRENRQLQVQVDSLSIVLARLDPNSLEARRQQLAYQRQLEAIAQTRLRQREMGLELEKREKLAEQRAKFMASQQNDPDMQAVLARINELEARLVMLESHSWRLYPKMEASDRTIEGTTYPVVKVVPVGRDAEGVKTTLRRFFAVRNIMASPAGTLQYAGGFPELHAETVSFRFEVEKNEREADQLEIFCLTKTKTEVLSDPKNDNYEQLLTLLELIFAE